MSTVLDPTLSLSASTSMHPIRSKVVSDVRLMEKYLTEDLGVPPNRIQLLLGSKEHTFPGDPMNPSRANIIDALLSIIDNPEILHGGQQSSSSTPVTAHPTHSKGMVMRSNIPKQSAPSIATPLVMMENQSPTSATESLTPS